MGVVRGVWFTLLGLMLVLVTEDDGDFVMFFFSSRRRHTRFDCDWSSEVFFSDLRIRHTRFDCDWSSDVCSSDLHARSARRAAISPMIGRLVRSRSPPHPNTTPSRPDVILRAVVSTRSSASGVWA